MPDNSLQNELLKEWPSNEGWTEPDVPATEMSPPQETEAFLKEHGTDKLYRIFPIERFFGLIEKHEMAFVHVSNWEDSNEAFRYLKGLKVDDSLQGNIGTFPSYASLYGQCWSLNNAEDSCYPWNFYGDDNKGQLVQVETSVYRLWHVVRAFFAKPDNPRVFCLRMGKVHYKNYSRLKRKQWTLAQMEKLGTGGTHAMFFDSLFVKNKPYSFEKEVRLIYDDMSFSKASNHPTLGNGGIVKLTDMSTGFIQCVTASPFMDEQTFLSLKVRIANCGLLPFLRQSTLFT